MHYPLWVILGGGVDCSQPISVCGVGGITNSVIFIHCASHKLDSIG